MKKVVFAVLALTAFLFGVALFWLNSPTVKDPAQVEQLVSRSREQFEAQKKTGNDSKTNGYLDPELLEVWKPGASSDHALRQKLDQWNEKTSSLGDNKRIPQATLQSAEIKEQRKSLAPTLGKIRAAFEKPQFFIPIEAVTIGKPDFNVFGLRVCAFAISGEAEVDAAQKNYKTLIDTVSDLGIVADHLDANCTLVNLAAATTLRRVAVNTVLVALTPSSSLTDAQWSALAQGLEKGAQEADLLKPVMEAEFGESCLSLEAILEDAKSGKSDAGFIATKLLERESRIYKNRMLEFINSPDPIAELAKINSLDGSEGAYLSGTYGKMTTSLIPAFDLITTRLEYFRRRQLAMSCQLGLLAFKSKFKKTAGTLEELAQVGLKPEQFKADWLVYSGGKLSIDVSVIPEAEYKEIVATTPAVNQGWYEYKAGKLEFGSI